MNKIGLELHALAELKLRFPNSVEDYWDCFAGVY
jgi:hypothetical protein